MKRLIIPAALFLLSSFPSYAQVFLHNIFPMGVNGDAYGDTLQNTSELMRKEGIREITVYQTRPELTKTYASKTVRLNARGTIETIRTCERKNEQTGFILCIDDSIIYDQKGRMVEIKNSDNAGNVYPRRLANYVNENEARFLTIGAWKKGGPVDTLIEVRYFNEKGQWAKATQARNGTGTSYASIFYNGDETIDSVSYENSPSETLVFRGSKKGKTKIIEMENHRARFKWTYNLSGQCISTFFKIKSDLYIPQRPEFSSETKINYYYNPNGTLSKIVLKTKGQPEVTWFYSYAK